MSVDEFRARFAEAAGIEPEAPAAVVDTAEEVPGAEEVPEVEETEEVVEEPVEETETEEAPDPDAEAVASYLEKYSGDVDAALKAAAEAQKIIGRQSAEVAEARKMSEQLEELKQLVAAREEPEPEKVDYDAASIDDYLLENPGQIPALAQRAIDTQDGYLYNRALAAWGVHDSVGAMDFHARAVSAAEIAKLREEMTPAIQSAKRAETTNEFAAAYETVAGTHEDFAQIMNSITDATIAGFPKSVLASLQTGDQVTKQEVLETLYRWTKAEQAGNLTQAASNAARQTKQDSRAARQEAAVATTTTSQSREAVSGLDAFHEAFQSSDAFRKAAGLA